MLCVRFIDNSSIWSDEKVDSHSMSTLERECKPARIISTVSHANELTESNERLGETEAVERTCQRQGVLRFYGRFHGLCRESEFIFLLCRIVNATVSEAIVECVVIYSSN